MLPLQARGGGAKVAIFCFFSCLLLAKEACLFEAIFILILPLLVAEQRQERINRIIKTRHEQRSKASSRGKGLKQKCFLCKQRGSRGRTRGRRTSKGEAEKCYLPRRGEEQILFFMAPLVINNQRQLRWKGKGE
jgi:hypothetical protein